MRFESDTNLYHVIGSIWVYVKKNIDSDQSLMIFQTLKIIEMEDDISDINMARILVLNKTTFEKPPRRELCLRGLFFVTRYFCCIYAAHS